jgi:pimeloyl-ACP methyl ester carboxylesterase
MPRIFSAPTRPRDSASAPRLTGRRRRLSARRSGAAGLLPCPACPRRGSMASPCITSSMARVSRCCSLTAWAPTSRCWPRSLPGFERSFRVVAFDNRGAGRTDKPDAPYTIELMAQDTAALIGVLSLRRANVLGISMGGGSRWSWHCPARPGWAGWCWSAPWRPGREGHRVLAGAATAAAEMGRAAARQVPAAPLCLSAAAPGFGQLRRHGPAGRHPGACPDPAWPAG